MHICSQAWFSVHPHPHFVSKKPVLAEILDFSGFFGTAGMISASLTCFSIAQAYTRQRWKQFRTDSASSWDLTELQKNWSTSSSPWEEPSSSQSLWKDRSQYLIIRPAGTHVGKGATAQTQESDPALPRDSVDTSTNRQGASPGSGTQSPIQYAASTVPGTTLARAGSAPPGDAQAPSRGQQRPAIATAWQAGSWTIVKACQLARGPKNGPCPSLSSHLSVQT